MYNKIENMNKISQINSPIKLKYKFQERNKNKLGEKIIRILNAWKVRNSQVFFCFYGIKLMKKKLTIFCHIIFVTHDVDGYMRN